MSDIDQAKGQDHSDSQSTIAKMWTQLAAVIVAAVAVGAFYWKVIGPISKGQVELVKINAEIDKKVRDEQLREVMQQRDALRRQIEALQLGTATTGLLKPLIAASSASCRFDSYVRLEGGTKRTRKDLLEDELVFLDAQCAVERKSFRAAKYSVTCLGCE